MTREEMQEQAKAEVQSANPDSSGLRVSKIYENVLDGTLVTVAFKNKLGNEELSHVHFGRKGPKFYRYHSDVLSDVSHHKERIWFFRFLEFAGMGGLIAFTLVLIFSALLCVLAFNSKDGSSSIIEVVKLSFTTILGFFFGSQASGRKLN
jgi:hypothetical protein